MIVTENDVMSLTLFKRDPLTLVDEDKNKAF